MKLVWLIAMGMCDDYTFTKILFLYTQFHVFVCSGTQQYGDVVLKPLKYTLLARGMGVRDKQYGNAEAYRCYSFTDLNANVTD
jgi:hypothetical protein